MGEEVEVGHTPFFRRPKEFTTTLARNIITDFTMVWVPNVYFIAVHVGTNVRGSQKKMLPGGNLGPLLSWLKPAIRVVRPKISGNLRKKRGLLRHREPSENNPLFLL